MNIFESMKVFNQVAETASFTRAAENLGLPKASVSSALQGLEERLGTRLFHRTTRKVQLTHDGIAFLERSKDMIADIDELESMFRMDPRKLSGRIRIDMPNSFASNVVLPKLPEFMERHPGIEIEFSSSDRRVNVVQEGFDLVVRVGSLGESGLISKKIGAFAPVNVASPGYIKKFGKPKSIEDLKNHRIVHYSQTLSMKNGGFDYFDGKETIEVPMEGSIVVNNVEAYRAACLAGLGLIQVPRLPVQSFIDRGLLVEVLPKFQMEPMPITLLYPHRRNLPMRVQIFMTWLTETIQTYLGGKDGKPI
jgi:DNA-binding transcriptional LysR family regulator